MASVLPPAYPPQRATQLVVRDVTPSGQKVLGYADTVMQAAIDRAMLNADKRSVTAFVEFTDPDGPEGPTQRLGVAVKLKESSLWSMGGVLEHSPDEWTGRFEIRKEFKH